MMKTVVWIVAILLSVPVIYMGLIYGASELGGEVVILDRLDANGEVSQVRIWVVDQGDASFVEHGDANAFWITDLADSPTVVLNRGGESLSYIGVADNDSHDLYHELRAEKYSWADQLIANLTGGNAECEGLPVRLSLVSK